MFHFSIESFFSFVPFLVKHENGSGGNYWSFEFGGSDSRLSANFPTATFKSFKSMPWQNVSLCLEIGCARYSLTRRKFDVNLSAIQNVVEKGHKPFPLLWFLEHLHIRVRISTMLLSMSQHVSWVFEVSSRAPFSYSSHYLWLSTSSRMINSMELPLQPSAALLSSLVAFAINIIQLTWPGNAQKEVQDNEEPEKEVKSVLFHVYWVVLTIFSGFLHSFPHFFPLPGFFIRTLGGSCKTV